MDRHTPVAVRDAVMDIASDVDCAIHYRSVKIFQYDQQSEKRRPSCNSGVDEVAKRELDRPFRVRVIVIDHRHTAVRELDMRDGYGWRCALDP